MPEFVNELAFIALCASTTYLLLLRRDLAKLSQSLTKMVDGRERAANRRLTFKISKRISNTLSLLTASATKKLLEPSTSDRILKVNESIFFSGESSEEVCRRTLRAIRRELGPSLTAGALSLNLAGGSLKTLSASFGFPKDRVDNQILILMESSRGISEPDDLFGMFNISSRYTNVSRGTITVGLYLGFENESEVNIFLLNGIWKRIIRMVESMGNAGLRIEELGKDRDYLLGLSHDLRAPIASALYANHSLRERLGNIEEIESIDYAINEQLLVIDNTLDLAKNNEELFRVHPLAFNLNNEVRSVVNKLSWMAKEYEVVLKSNIDEKLEVIFDRDQFHRIIQNFCVNAVKYSGSKTVEIRSSSTDSGAIEILVLDQGKGINSETQLSLFERPGNAKTCQGHGHGLYVSSMLARANRGKVFYRKNLPNGSIFGLLIVPPERSLQRHN